VAVAKSLDKTEKCRLSEAILAPYASAVRVSTTAIVLQKSLFQRHVTARNEAVSYLTGIASSQRTRTFLAMTFAKRIGKN
jgi:hypothetical protein